jgi:hypothetical protein
VFRKYSRRRALAEAQSRVVPAPFDDTSLRTEADEIRSRAGARRLQPHQHAHRLQQRCLPLRIAADEQRKFRMRHQFRVLEATEIAQHETA